MIRVYGQQFGSMRDPRTRNIQDCPAIFLPIHKTACRFVAGYGRVPMPSRNEDTVMFVCPLPSLGYYYSFILYVYVN